MEGNRLPVLLIGNAFKNNPQPNILMLALLTVAAAGYSLIYLLLGGGLGGAVLIFIVAKMFGK